MKKKETVLVLCSHNDDGVIGAGGTLAKYAAEGKQVLTVIFSYGEQSLPQLKPEVVKERRIREMIQSDKILGGGGITYLGLREGHFEEDAVERNAAGKIKYIIKKYKPTKVFTHSIDDPYPDHRACYKISWEILEGIPGLEVYTFDVWNILNIKHRNMPKMVSDITKTMEQKMNSFKAHESQLKTPGVFLLYWKTYINNIICGMKHGVRYAEEFVKLQ